MCGPFDIFWARACSKLGTFKRIYGMLTNVFGMILFFHTFLLPDVLSLRLRTWIHIRRSLRNMCEASVALAIERSAAGRATFWIGYRIDFGVIKYVSDRLWDKINSAWTGLGRGNRPPDNKRTKDKPKTREPELPEAENERTRAVISLKRGARPCRRPSRQLLPRDSFFPLIFGPGLLHIFSRFGLPFYAILLYFHVF